VPSSDKSIGILAKNIHNELLPIQDEDEDDKSQSFHAIFPQVVVEDAIKSILDRNNYGLDPPPGGKHMASFSVWRWEVKDEFRDWLPKNAQEKAANRLADRIQVCGLFPRVALHPHTFLAH
jgi:chromatin assembly factor 1 subunit A